MNRRQETVKQTLLSGIPEQVRVHCLQLPTGARLVDEIECLLSVLLAIFAAHLVGAKHIYWAAFSAYMVLRGPIADSFLRGSLRILGTALGAGLALTLVPAVQLSWPMTSLAAAIIGGFTLYCSLTHPYSYAWLFIGLTFEIILLDKLAYPGHAITTFAATRLIEVVSGTVACLIVRALTNLTVRRHWPNTRLPSPQWVGWHPHALRHALQAAVALALLPLIGSIFSIRELAQGAVSIMAVMLVPITSLGVSGLVPVSLKLVQRIIGCLIGCALAGVFLLIAHGNPFILITGTAIGVIVGRHIENSDLSFSYVGTQLTLATLIALVPDSYVTAAGSYSALERLYGMVFGMVLLEPVLVAWHLIRPVAGEPLSKG